MRLCTLKFDCIFASTIIHHVALQQKSTAMKKFVILLLACSLFITSKASEHPSPSNNTWITLKQSIKKVVVGTNVTLVLTPSNINSGGQLGSTPEELAQVNWSFKKGTLLIEASCKPVTVYLSANSLGVLVVESGAEVKTQSPLQQSVVHVQLHGTAKAAIQSTGRIRISSGDDTELVVLNQRGKIDMK